jgi:hypothetical protein
LDSDQYHQRARWPVLSHGSVDGQQNDRMGREEQFHQFEHRRQILRNRTESDTDANSEPNTDRNCYRNSNAHRKPDALYR